MGWSGRAPAPPAGDAGKGRQRRGARHVTQAQCCNRRDRYRYRRELVSRGGSRLAWRDRDAEAIAEAVQRPTMKFVATKTAEPLDLQALHRVRERLVSQRTGIINQIRAFLLERGVAVGKACASCALSCQAFSPRPVMSCRRAWCGCSRTWLRTGAGSMSASSVYRVRSRLLRAGMRVVSA